MMAFCGFSTSPPTQLQLLLEEIKFQQQKELQNSSVQDGGCFMTRGTTYWTDVFVRHFLFHTDTSIDADDLLFFIRKRHSRNVTLPKFTTEVEVFRKDSKKLPIGDPEIEWQETVFLNLLIHQLEYTLTLAICTRTSPKDLQVLKRHSQKVYASPSRRRMDTKGEFEEITYPFLSFMVDNFDEVYSEMTVRDGEMVVVELMAKDRDQGFQAVLFLGSIRYDALKRVYDSRASIGSKMAQRMTFGFFSSSSSQRVEYVRLKGPYGKGHAEVAVSKPKGAGVETPTSEPGFCMTDGIWDSDNESDSEDFVFKHHRRLSDPSSNLNNFARSGWRSIKGNEGGTAKKTRSQNEGLDYCGLAEIEAGDVRDDQGAWCSGCCPRCDCMRNEVTCCSKTLKSSIGSSSSGCSCCCPSPFPRSQSVAFDMMPIKSEIKEEAHGRKRHQLLSSKTVVLEPPTSIIGRLLSAPNKAASISCLQDAKQICKEKLLRTVPNKLTNTGIRILYNCDNMTELDDGALWTMRGFTQTLAFIQSRRAQSIPLNAFLTYITLPCSTIMKDILERREEPVLTF